MESVDLLFHRMNDIGVIQRHPAREQQESR